MLQCKTTDDVQAEFGGLSCCDDKHLHVVEHLTLSEAARRGQALQSSGTLNLDALLTRLDILSDTAWTTWDDDETFRYIDGAMINHWSQSEHVQMPSSIATDSPPPTRYVRHHRNASRNIVPSTNPVAVDSR